jgi:DNA polymerase-3 subunit gamma/tau
LSFLVTARKWRPQTFEQVVGQEGAARTLQNALRAGRIAHAFIFAGPRGVGKTTTARLLAKAINCIKGPTPEPCNQCVSCQEIAEGRSLDVLEIDGASNRGVGEIRNLRENIRFNPVGSRKRIYIIDEVHMLTIEAFNALLKTLEEPPEHAIFIFATTEMNRVPATILSRCQRFDFRRLTAPEIAGQLRHIADHEGLKADDEALGLLARRADGAMRDGQSLLDQMATFAPEGITAEQVRTALGIVPEDLYFRASDLVFGRDMAVVFEIVDEIDTRGHSPREFLRGLCDHFINFLKARDAKSAAFIEAPLDVAKRYQEVARKLELNDLLRVLAILQEAFTDIRRHPNPRLKLELTLLRLASLEHTEQIEELLANLRGENPQPSRGFQGNQTPPRSGIKPKPAAESTPKPLEPESKTTAATAPTPRPAVAISTATWDLDYIRQYWHQIVDQVCEGRGVLACQLKLGRPERLEEGFIVTSFGSDLHDLQLERLQKVAVSGGFDQGLQTAFGSPVRLRFERHAAFSPQETTASTQEADPLDQEVMRRLGARPIG